MADQETEMLRSQLVVLQQENLHLQKSMEDFYLMSLLVEQPLFEGEESLHTYMHTLFEHLAITKNISYVGLCLESEGGGNIHFSFRLDGSHEKFRGPLLCGYCEKSFTTMLLPASEVPEVCSSLAVQTTHQIPEVMICRLPHTSFGRACCILVDAEEGNGPLQELIPTMEMFCHALAVKLDNFSLHKSLKGINSDLEQCVAKRTEELRQANVQLQVQMKKIQEEEDERAKLTHQIHQMQKLESLGILAGGVAHDFNNLLGGIFGCIELASTSNKNSHVQESLDMALSVIDRARGLTRQLLTFSKGGAPQKQLNTLFPFVQETVFFALSGSAVVCTTEVDPDLWMVEYDRNQLSQVIENLVINAKQALENKGKIEIGAHNVLLRGSELQVLSAGPYVLLSVRDYGCGMTQEQLSHIFDPFYTTKKEGYGLGLTTSYSIIKHHGGSIEVHSEVGQGTEFLVYLPASCSGRVQTSQIPVQEVHKEVPLEEQRDGVVVVVDDDATLRQILGKIIEKYGYRVVLFENGNEALHYLDQGNLASVVAILADLTIPGAMGGQELQVVLAQRGEKIPLFVTSGYGEDPVMLEPQKFGFTASLRKPFLRDDVYSLFAHLTPITKEV